MCNSACTLRRADPIQRIVNRAAIGPTGPIGPAGLVWSGAWSGATAYVANDAVSLAGSAYICILAHTNFTPPNATYWNLLAGPGLVNPMTTAGDVILGGAAGAAGRLAIGTAGKVLLSDGTTAAWQVVLKTLGAQTVGVAQVTIAHGLAYTPTVCIAQMTSAGQIWRSAASDGTNVYLTSDLAGRTCEVYVR